MSSRSRGVRWWKSILVIIASIGLTSLAIYASDTIRIPGTSFLAKVGVSQSDARCPEDMVFVNASGGGFCIDRYENSPGKTCGAQNPANAFETQTNVNNSLCVPVSKKGVQPWVYVPMHQAQLLCARVGKRLPTNAEWYRGALGTLDMLGESQDDCVIGRKGMESADVAGHARCVSASGAEDMVGNVWEWVDGVVQDGVYDGNMLPDAGYVAEIGVDGVPVRTRMSSDPAFGGDYFFVDKAGHRGMFRGGFYATDDRAGVYTINVTTPATFVGVAVGFRCAK